MKFPMAGVDDFEEYLSTCHFYGDFANSEKRQQIFSKPRKYELTLHFHVREDEDVEYIDVISTHTKIDYTNLAELIHYYSEKYSNDFNHLVLEKSYVEIKLV